MHYRLFDTALGTMGLGWTEAGISRLLLPGDAPEEMGARLARHGGEEDAGGRDDVVARIVAYAAGATDNFADVGLDLSAVPPMHRRIYDHIRGVGWGETTTYGAIARWLGDVALSRAVGAAMGANPIPLIVPCHRVLGADGKIGGFSAPGGVGAKLEMLALERAATPDGQLPLGL